MTKDIEALDAECAALPMHADVVQIDKGYNEKNKDTYGYRRFLCKRLIEMGYRKVVLCKDCGYLEERKLVGLPIKVLYICTSPHSHMKGMGRISNDYYCSEGIPKEGIND